MQPILDCPQELRLSKPPNVEGDSAMDIEDFNARSGTATLGFTENNSLTYTATDDPCLDLFFHVVPSTPANELKQRIEKAWAFNPLKTLKLVCNIRGVRGTGKSDKERFYTAAMWLHKHHPKTLAGNVGLFVEFGYHKDLLEILYRLLEGEDARAKVKQERESNKMEKLIFRYFPSKKRNANAKTKTKGKLLWDHFPEDFRIASTRAKVESDKARARTMRKENTLAKAKKAYDRYNRDPEFRYLHDCVSDFFADRLKSDMRFMNMGELSKISFAAKWCPSIDSSYDKALMICESISKRIFPRGSNPDYENIDEAHYAYRVRDRLRKEVLVPLHKVLELPEVYMSANQWDSLPYSRVPSVAMKNYKTHFMNHDNERFQEFLENVKNGKASIAAGALLPHEIVASLDDEDGGQVAELQWKRMVDDLLQLGQLKNCIAVCDVSGSMAGTPMEVCVALGLMISELSEDPWKGKVITFSERPQLHIVKGDNLKSKTGFIRNMEWGANTDFQKVFDRILEVAVSGNLTEDQMIRKIFVFSDMEFDHASGYYNSDWFGSYRYDYGYSSETESSDESVSDDDDSGSDSDFEGERRRCKKAWEKKKKQEKRGWESDYDVIVRKFKEKGFNKVPQIVFWNLRNSSATPVNSDQKGVALVSGFSKNMVKLFLNSDEVKMNPVSIMDFAISGDLYQKLVIYD